MDISSTKSGPGWMGSPMPIQCAALTALQLSHDGILPIDPQQSVQLSIGGRRLGALYLQWLRGAPGHEFGGPVLIHFLRVRAIKVKD